MYESPVYLANRDARRDVNLSGMWRVHRLDQINALKRANLFEFKSLTLKFWSKQIGPFKTVIRSEPGRAGQKYDFACEILWTGFGLWSAESGGSANLADIFLHAMPDGERQPDGVRQPPICSYCYFSGPSLAKKTVRSEDLGVSCIHSGTLEFVRHLADWSALSSRLGPKTFSRGGV